MEEVFCVTRYLKTFLAYVCAGKGQCLNDPFNEPDINALCSIYYKTKGGATHFCRQYQSTTGCDGILMYKNPQIGS